MTPKSQAKIKPSFPRYSFLTIFYLSWCQIYAIYTLNYYQDKYFISHFAHFKHTVKTYNHGAYTQNYYKNTLMIKVLKIFWWSNFDVNLKTQFLREQF